MEFQADQKPQSKVAHLQVCLSDQVEYQKSAGFEQYDLLNQAASEVSLQAIDLSVSFLKRDLSVPLMIAPMTGGVKEAILFNRRLAQAAQHFGMPMGVGSQRVGLENKDRALFYDIRQDAPDIMLFGNIGAGQLCKGWGVNEARRAVEMIRADALFIHLNAVQEACQGGDVNFHHLLHHIETICAALGRDGIPVCVREVGFGLSKQAAKRLIDVGVHGLDCAGAGGTSWAKVEMHCASSERRRQMGERFAEWGIPTAQSILEVREASESVPLIATGGIRSGLDVVKALLLGADMTAMARPFLVAANQGEEALYRLIEDLLLEIRICLFALGIESIHKLKQSPHCMRRIH